MCEDRSDAGELKNPCAPWRPEPHLLRLVLIMSFVPNVIVREPHFPEYRRAPVLSESYVEATGLRLGIRVCFAALKIESRHAWFDAIKIEPRLEAIGSASCSSPVVGYLVETSQIIGVFLEIGDSVPIANVPKRADHGHEGSFAGAVLAHEEGQRRKPGGLLLSKTAKILERYAVHGNLFLYGLCWSIAESITFRNRFFTPPHRLDEASDIASLTAMLS